MAQIGGLPTVEPVGVPSASPGEFASPGATVAALGHETEQLAQQASQLDGYLLSAQRQLKAKQAQIAFDQAKNVLYDDLRKAVTPEEAEAMYQDAKGRLDGVLRPYETDRVLSRELGV